MTDNEYMDLALCQARLAADAGEVPVGAVAVLDGKVVAAAYNSCETDGQACAHAEMKVIREASEKLGRWRLQDLTVYVTMEPCPMCAGAMMLSRVGRIVYGVKNAQAGACGSVLDLRAYPLPASYEATGGVREKECLALLQEFFKKRRNTDNSDKK